MMSVRGVIAAVCAAAACAGCAGPTLSDHAMRSQASRSAESAVSEIETIKLAVQTQLDGGSWWRFTDSVVTDSETALDSIESTIASRQPPSDATATARAEVVSAIGDAADIAARARIAVRQHDEEQLSELLPELDDASRQLTSLESSVS
jgi:putative intracellular protease/amidase